MANYSKRCKDCGRFINIRQMPHGQWVAFEGEQIHKCEAPIQRETIRSPKPIGQRPTENPSKPFTPFYPEVSSSQVAQPKPPPPRGPDKTVVQLKSPPPVTPTQPSPTPTIPSRAATAKRRTNVFGAVGGFITVLLGSAFGIFFMFFGLFSIPLSTLAVMHFTGWPWFGALAAIMISACVPVIGQVGHLILAAIGAYFLWNANFEWHKATYPAPQTFNISALSETELDRFKVEVVRPGFEQACKSGALKNNGFDGKLPERIASRCECFAAEFSARLTRDDLLAFEKTGEYPLGTQERLKGQLQQACSK